MKFMEKAKRFFTLNAANHEGFTLVELIVVIAILAILAGIAVPAYSGYITKAKEAADYTQLDSMKTAIAFAVAEKDASGKLTGATINFTTATDDLTKVSATYDVAGTSKTEVVNISEFVGADYVPQSGAAKAVLADGKWTLSK